MEKLGIRHKKIVGMTDKAVPSPSENKKACLRASQEVWRKTDGQGVARAKFDVEKWKSRVYY